jgi:hypothetical protein
MITAHLINGKTVELKKECACTNHDGPHWLFLDHFLKQRIQALAAAAFNGMREATNMADFRWHKAQWFRLEQLDRQRIHMTWRHLNRLGIVTIHYEEWWEQEIEQLAA